MFGFYKNNEHGEHGEKNNEHGGYGEKGKHNDGLIPQDAAETSAGDVKGETTTNSEGFGFLGRFATDEDYQRQVVKRYVRYPETRDYLNQIKNCKQRIELLTKRQSYRSNVNMDIADIGVEITMEGQKLARLLAEISDEISKLGDVRQEMVLTKRYIDGLQWEDIASDMNSGVRSVQSIHGRGLPAMEQVLVADGLIELSSVNDMNDDGHGEYDYRSRRDNSGRSYHHDSEHGGDHRSEHHGSQKYWRKPYCHPEVHGDKGYEETAADDKSNKSRELYGVYDDYEFFSD